MKKEKLKVISAAASLSMLLGCATYVQPAYAEAIPNADLSPIKEFTGADIGVKVSVKEDDEVTSNAINPTLTITNTSDKEMNLEDLKLKYYYTADGEQDETFNCYYAGTVDGNYRALTSYVQGKIVKMGGGYEDADSYMELTFNGGTLDAGQSAMIQTSINKNDWSNYDRSNDFSYNNASKIEVSMKGAPDTNPSEDDKKEKTLSLTTDDIECTAEDVINIPVKLSGLTKDNDLCGCVFKLQYDTDVLEDVSVSAGDICSAYKSALSSKVDKDAGIITILYADDTGEGTHDLTEDGVFLNIQAKVKSTVNPGKSELKVYDKGSFSDGEYNDYKPEFNLGSINVNPAPLKNSDVYPTTVIWDQYSDEDVKFTMTLNGNSFAGIAGLTEGIDYTVSDNVVTLRGNYLETLSVDVHEFTFNFSSGEPVKVTVNTGKFHRPGVEISSGDVSAAPGERITIPVKFEYAGDVAGCYFKLQYDTDVLEDVTVKAGDICASSKYFSKVINKSTGVISVLYSDPGDGTGYITEDGVFMTISATVKADAKTGDYKLKVYDEGSFADEDEVEFDPDFWLGSIKVRTIC